MAERDGFTSKEGRIGHLEERLTDDELTLSVVVVVVGSLLLNRQLTVDNDDYSIL